MEYIYALHENKYYKCYDVVQTQPANATLTQISRQQSPYQITHAPASADFRSRSTATHRTSSDVKTAATAIYRRERASGLIIIHIICARPRADLSVANFTFVQTVLEVRWGRLAAVVCMCTYVQPPVSVVATREKGENCAADSESSLSCDRPLARVNTPNTGSCANNVYN